MLSKFPPFHIVTEIEIRKHLSENEFFELVSPFFLLVNAGNITVESDKIRTFSANSISVYVKDEEIRSLSLSENCECILLQYDRKYIRSMTLKLDLLDAFKYVYSDPQLTFNLPENEFDNLWFLANYISDQLENSQHSNLENHIFRHLNYSFLYSCIERINRASSFEANPRNQQEKLVLNFLKNLQIQGSSKLNVSDYAKMQHVTTRHLSATVKHVTGLPALEIIHRLMMRRAKTELTETDAAISEIALDLGYTDPFTFSHFFKKKSGLSPSDFRAKFQG